MDKLWTIAFKDIRTRFTDRRLLLIMLAAPLAIATIIGLAFGGLSGGSSPVSHIPVAVINNDQPGPQGLEYGTILAALLTTGEMPARTGASLASCPRTSGGSAAASGAGGMTLAELIQGTAFDEAQAGKLVAEQKIEAPSAPAGSVDYLGAAARSAVDKGIYSAVVIIPSGFSSALGSLADPRQPERSAAVTVYGNGGDTVSAGIVRSVVQSITEKLVSGNIAIGATVRQLAQTQPAALQSGSALDFGRLFVCAFAPGNGMVQMADLPVQAAPNTLAGTLLVTFGSAQALFFALFTGQSGVLSMYDERHNGTLQRILISPTPRWAILGGKLVGVVISVLVQLLALVLALTVVGSLLEGRLAFIWGTDIGRLALLLLAVSVAVSGLGIFLAGVLKSVEQADVVGSVLNIALGVLGGAFGFQLPRAVAQFSLIYWARDGFDLLASGRGDITLNLLVLAAEGAAMFAVGLVLFNRRFEA